MKIGVIGAMQMEVDNLKEAMEDVRTDVYSGVTYVSGTIDDREIVAAVCGIGKVFAAICAEAMILKFDVDYVINIGVAGTLCKELGVMDVAVAMAFATVRTEGRGLYLPVWRYSGTTSFAFEAATKFLIGSPIFFANIPAARLP